METLNVYILELVEEDEFGAEFIGASKRVECFESQLGDECERFAEDIAGPDSHGTFNVYLFKGQTKV